MSPSCEHTAAAVREAAAYARAKPWLGAHGAVERLANWVFNRMARQCPPFPATQPLLPRAHVPALRNSQGGVIADQDAITAHMDGLAVGHEASVLVTQIEVGTCRQRALLFKLVFDHLVDLQEPLLEVPAAGPPPPHRRSPL